MARLREDWFYMYHLSPHQDSGHCEILSVSGLNPNISPSCISQISVSETEILALLCVFKLFQHMTNERTLGFLVHRQHTFRPVWYFISCKSSTVNRIGAHIALNKTG